MRRKLFSALFVVFCFALGFAFLTYWEGTRPTGSPSGYLPKWDPAKAATYLDTRELWWQNWLPAKRAQGTYCVSCHTALPYAMARPLLPEASGQIAAPTPETDLISNIARRVTNWAQMPPYYSDHAGPGKAGQSRATEAVLNAVILASYDTRIGQLRPVTRTAFEEAWALQETSGSEAGGWQWQDFQLEPWESAESAYQGAALLAEKVENAPDGYATALSTLPYLNRQWDYLQRGYSQQSVMNQLYVLWASAKSPQPLSPQQRETLLKALRRLQHRDGGWSLAQLDASPKLDRWHWVRRQMKYVLHPPPSDGCATGLVAFVLLQSGASHEDPMLSRGLQWLMQHQRLDGSWRADSLNAQRDPESGVGRFMSDAATGYAVMALEAAQVK